MVALVLSLTLLASLPAEPPPRSVSAAPRSGRLTGALVGLGAHALLPPGLATKVAGAAGVRPEHARALRSAGIAVRVLGLAAWLGSHSHSRGIPESGAAHLALGWGARGPVAAVSFQF